MNHPLHPLTAHIFQNNIAKVFEQKHRINLVWLLLEEAGSCVVAVNRLPISHSIILCKLAIPTIISLIR